MESDESFVQKTYIRRCEDCNGKAVVTTCSDDNWKRLYFVVCNANGREGIISGCGKQSKICKTEEGALLDWNKSEFE